MNTKKITLSGGFHNCSPINIYLPTLVADSLKKGEISITDYHVLTRSQRQKLDRHFCGIPGCKCGGVARASIDFND